MWAQKLFRHKKIVVELCLMALLASASPSKSMQTAEAMYSAVENSATRPAVFATRDPAPPKTKKSPSPDLDRFPLTPAKKAEIDKITSFFVRANDSKRIQLSILVTHKKEFTQAVRQLLQENVTPLLFSVSTLPNRTINFDPALLRFEQRGRIWQPNGVINSIDIWPLEEGGQFGGVITESQAHQGVILLPGWFDSQAPITVRYGDFRYLARFAQE
jgi:hypothetical protein